MTLLLLRQKFIKLKKFMYFWQMCIKSDWMESELSGDFLNYPDSLWIIQTVSGLSRQFLYQPGSLWNVRTVFRLSGKSLDCPDSFYIIRTVSGFSRQFLNYPESL